MFILQNFKKTKNYGKKITTIALFAVLGTLAVSCQKENIVEQTSIVSENQAVYKMRYSIDGTVYHITLVGDEARYDFLNRMIALAEAGHRISFRNEEASSQTVSAKDVVTYTTTNHNEAIKWADKMEKDGYEVTITYNERTGEYTCTAVK